MLDIADAPGIRSRPRFCDGRAVICRAVVDEYEFPVIAALLAGHAANGFVDEACAVEEDEYAGHRRSGRHLGDHDGTTRWLKWNTRSRFFDELRIACTRPRYQPVQGRKVTLIAIGSATEEV